MGGRGRERETGCMAIRRLGTGIYHISGFMFAMAARYRNAGSTPDLFQIERTP